MTGSKNDMQKIYIHRISILTSEKDIQVLIQKNNTAIFNWIYKRAVKTVKHLPRDDKEKIKTNQDRRHYLKKIKPKIIQSTGKGFRVGLFDQA